MNYSRFKSNLLLVSVCAASVAVAGCNSVTQSSSGAPDAAPPALPSDSDIRRSSVTEAIERADGDLSAAMSDSAEYRALAERGDYAGMAIAFLNRYRADFRLENPPDDLQVVRVNADRLGYHHVRFNQTYRGLRVIDAELIVHFDPDDRLYLVQGHYLPTTAEVADTPPRPADEVRRLVAAELGPGFELDTGELVVLLPDVNTAARPVYRFEARRGLTERREVLVDPESGRSVRDIPLVLNAR